MSQLESDETRVLACAAVVELCKRGCTVACAESCTAGAFGAAFGGVPGASKVFGGGVIAYTVASKIAVLGINPDVANEEEAVNEACAIAMAQSVKKIFGTDYGMGITGFAGPTGGTSNVPIGTVWLALATPDGDITQKIRGKSERMVVQAISVRQSLKLLLGVLRDND